MRGLRVEVCGPERAEQVHQLTQAAFRGQADLDPPSGAQRETPEIVHEDLAGGGGALAWLDARPVGCLRMLPCQDSLYVRRVAVLPELQGRGIGRALMSWAEREAAGRGLPAVSVGVRLALPANVAFYERLGYCPVAEHAHPGYKRPTWVTMLKAVGERP